MGSTEGQIEGGGFQPLDYSSWDQDKSAYISAIQAGLSMNYQPMKVLVSRAVELN